MSDTIRVELSGKQSEAWNRMFDSFTSVIEKAVEQLAPNMGEDKRAKVKDDINDICEITKNFLQAKIEKPVLENEMIIADIAKKFEELKLIKANRKKIEAETEILEVNLEKQRLDLW
ncbi:MAG: hypothetical protein GY839_07710 [candidate division Zixibacteria bacterium]|nr:hypothetical protein [candidate division Zixibacteria bacterium]